MKKILAGCFALMLGVSAFAWDSSPEWIYSSGGWIWDGNDDEVVHIHDNGEVHVWAIIEGGYVYLGQE